VPPPGNHGVTKVAQRNYIGRGVGAALRPWRYVMRVKDTIRIAGPVAADLALLAVAFFDRSS
jgi:hypothetical protein